MADIKQAAKWMLEGKRVFCPMGYLHREHDNGPIVLIDSEGREEFAHFWVKELLADDWELAE